MPGKGKEWRIKVNDPLLTNVGNQSAFGSDFSTWVNYSGNLLDPHLVLWFLNTSHMGNSTVWGIIFASVKGGYFWIFSYFSSFQSQWHRCFRMKETEANQNALLFCCFALQELFSDYCRCGFFSLVNIWNFYLHQRFKTGSFTWYLTLWVMADVLTKWLCGKESPCQCRQYRRYGSDP